MSYKRVIPRDLFNESSLLKCLGRVALLIADGKAPEGMRLEHTNPTKGFEIDQSPSSGDLCCLNLVLVTKGGRAFIWRGLNSREEWSIFVGTDYYEDIELLDSKGNFTAEFLAWTQLPAYD